MAGEQFSRMLQHFRREWGFGLFEIGAEVRWFVHLVTGAFRPGWRAYNSFCWMIVRQFDVIQ